MELKYTSPFEREPGILSWLLNKSYAYLVESEPELWAAERENWLQFDRDVFNHPETIGACTFLSWYETDIVGLYSFDPRQRPAYGIIGHNCVLPEFQGQGFGKLQILQILKWFKKAGIRAAKVSTNDHQFFIPAQRMYTACGFHENKRVPWDRDPKQNMIHYEMVIG